jgi:hypothetical protein
MGQVLIEDRAGVIEEDRGQDRAGVRVEVLGEDRGQVFRENRGEGRAEDFGEDIREAIGEESGGRGRGNEAIADIRLQIADLGYENGLRRGL